MLESVKERSKEYTDGSGGIHGGGDVGGSLLSSSVNVMSTNTITNTPQGAAAAAAAGGGPASNSATMGIPCHLLNIQDIKPVLEFLMSCYSVHMNVDDMEGGSDEMELISIVTRKPEKDPKQEKMMMKLRQRNSIDELLRAQSRFISVQDSVSHDDNVDIPGYGHSLVDRHAILLDLWTNEAEFLENKRQLLDVYLEAYHNVFDMHEKRALAQEMTNIVHKRPRFDFKTDYFVKTYKMESRCLKLHCGVVKSVSDKQIESQREYIKRITREGNKFGLPHAIVQKQPISINLSRPALKHVFLLEFHPSLALVSRIPQAVRYACNLGPGGNA
eukprot:XP_011670838.1 PREDICTED: uncharacterized protein LOC105441433 [Strongylocentrotus purpuratus]